MKKGKWYKKYNDINLCQNCELHFRTTKGMLMCPYAYLNQKWVNENDE